MPTITQNHTTVNYSAQNGAKKYIVWHDTGVKGQTAAGNANYFKSVDRKASANYFVDKTSIYEVVAPNLVAWHCGDGHGKYGITNQNSIGIELCAEADGTFHVQTIANAVWLGKKLMKDFGISYDNNVRHYDASRKNCPQYLNTDGKWTKWYAFKAQLNTTTVATPAPTRGGLAVGTKVTVRSAATHYQTGQPIASWVKGSTYAIKQVKAVNQSASKRAYLLDGINSWVLEQDVIPRAVIAPAPSEKSFRVQVATDALNVRTGPGTGYGIVSVIRDKGVYTITATSGDWGKLKSGAGWISLAFTKRV